jgi:hypothetical protein
MEILVGYVMLIVVTGLFANYKGRSMGNWAGWAVLFGPFPLLLLCVMPKKTPPRVLRPCRRRPHAR